ncbi:hypothetical protein BV25DRAFT_1823679 [Artomyces pyxidatus]|uniref:Uncharacterized protein n=1 Tax=Artomyces pyxidatus TaxID=48021 RepID=A0ACB8T7Z9_9AGAM|nr:hypothetical protein BV25DRAFT_1823679 [Artomyces pyxidatus]
MPPEVHPTSPAQPSSYQGPAPHYQSAAPLRPRGGFMRPQYTMSIPQQPLSMVPSPPQYAYPRHPGMPGSEPSLQHIAYSSSSIVPMMQQHAPMYPFQNHSSDSGSPSQHPFTTSAAPPPLPVYSHLAINPSPPPRSPLPPSQSSSSSGQRHSAPYATQGAYSPLGYSTPPQYAYAPPSSFAPNPSMYQSQYTPYRQTYTPTESDGQGTWWYLPAAGTAGSGSYEGMQQSYQSPYSMGYPSIGRHEGEGYGQPGPSSSIAATQPPVHSHLHPPVTQSRFGGSSTEITPDGSSPGLQGSPVTSSKPLESATMSISNEAERRLARKPYHPNPPAHRSEWVMWAGNVPSDATHDELWRFFNQSLSPQEPSSPGAAPDEASGGVLSIFLISRSNCAFVNFETEAHLSAATNRFNGKQLRPNDPRCPRLVCRIRRQTDDLRAGVGGQRGIGMHTKWIKEQKEKAQQERDTGLPSSSSERLEFPSTASSSSPEDLAGRLGPLSISDDESQRRNRRTAPTHSTSSGSYASTSSSILTRYFPQRYFILKSLTQFDLDLSVERGLWATQRHNEGILDQAFRTSQDVFLIFGVNKSGEFYGYAKMTGPISQGEGKVPWASPSASSPQSSSQASGSSVIAADAGVSPLDPVLGKRQEARYIFPLDEHRVDESPLPVSGSQEQPLFLPGPPEASPPHARGKVASAPAELRDPHHRLTHKTPQAELSLGVPRASASVGPRSIELDATAPYRALKGRSAGETSRLGARVDDVVREHLSDARLPSPRLPRREVSEPLIGKALRPVEEASKEERETREDLSQPDVGAGPGQDQEQDEAWGQPFRVEWIRTERLPFYRTRHLRNPWNHGREVKVSRDGTELEPSVGQELLEEWDRPPPSPRTSPVPAAARPPPQRRGSKTAHHPP